MSNQINSATHPVKFKLLPKDKRPFSVFDCGDSENSVWLKMYNDTAIKRFPGDDIQRVFLATTTVKHRTLYQMCHELTEGFTYVVMESYDREIIVGNIEKYQAEIDAGIIITNSLRFYIAHNRKFWLVAPAKNGNQVKTYNTVDDVAHDYSWSKLSVDEQMSEIANCVAKGVDKFYVPDNDSQILIKLPTM